MNNKKKKNIEEFEEIAKDYSRDLSWLAAIHVALRSKEGSVIPSANDLLVYPERHLLINNLPPDQARSEFDKGVDLFNKLCAFAIDLPFDPTGHYLNMSAIVHVDALLQGFLDRCFEKACQHKLLQALPLTDFTSKKKGQKKTDKQKSKLSGQRT